MIWELRWPAVGSCWIVGRLMSYGPCASIELERHVGFASDQLQRRRACEETGEDAGPGLQRSQVVGEVGKGRVGGVDQQLRGGGGEDVGAAGQRGREEADAVDAEQRGDGRDHGTESNQPAPDPECLEGSRQFHGLSFGVAYTAKKKRPAE